MAIHKRDDSVYTNRAETDYLWENTAWWQRIEKDHQDSEDIETVMSDRRYHDQKKCLVPKAIAEMTGNLCWQRAYGDKEP